MRKVLKGGRWVEGKAGPELLPKHMRRLPGDFVTKEVPDGERVHALDDPHVVDTIVRDRCREEASLDPAPPDIAGAAPVTKREQLTLNQRRVDEVRLRVLRACAETAKQVISDGGQWDKRVRHLWFPRDDINVYALRDGNPPADADRPPYLRGLELHIDVAAGVLPRTIVDRAAEEKIMAIVKGNAIKPVSFFQ